MQNIDKILSLSSDEAIDDAFSEINDLIEFNDIEIDEASVQEIVGKLIATAVNTKSYILKESILNLSGTILNSGGNYTTLNLDLLNDNINSLDGSSLEHALYILGLSKNINYIKTLNTFACNNDSVVKTAAIEALIELKHTCL